MPEPSNPTEIFLDLRAMVPPEPMQCVLDALTTLAPEQQLRLLIDREPHPLYRILDRNGYTYRRTEPEPGLYQIVIQSS